MMYSLSPFVNNACITNDRCCARLSRHIWGQIEATRENFLLPTKHDLLNCYLACMLRMRLYELKSMRLYSNEWLAGSACPVRRVPEHWCGSVSSAAPAPLSARSFHLLDLKALHVVGEEFFQSFLGARSY